MTEQNEAVEALSCATCTEPMDELSLELNTKDCLQCRSKQRDGEELLDLVTTEV